MFLRLFVATPAMGLQTEFLRVQQTTGRYQTSVLDGSLGVASNWEGRWEQNPEFRIQESEARQTEFRSWTRRISREGTKTQRQKRTSPVRQTFGAPWLLDFVRDFLSRIQQITVSCQSSVLVGRSFSPEGLASFLVPV